MTTHTPQSLDISGMAGDPTPAGFEGNASVRERATQVGGTAKDEAAGVAQEVKYQARDLVGEARGQLRQQVDTQKGRASDLLREISEELEQMAEGSDRNGIASEIARQAAGRARDVRGYLDGGGDVVDDVRRFARRRPGTFLLGALAVGVLAGRATRAAAAARRQQTENTSSRSFAADSPGHAGEAAGYAATPDTFPTGTAYGAAATGTAYGAAATGTAYGTAATGTAYGTTTTGAQYEDPNATYETAGSYGTGLPAGGAPTAYDTTDATAETAPLRDYPEGSLPPEREDRS